LAAFPGSGAAISFVSRGAIISRPADLEAQARGQKQVVSPGSCPQTVFRTELYTGFYWQQHSTDTVKSDRTGRLYNS